MTAADTVALPSLILETRCFPEHCTSLGFPLDSLAAGCQSPLLIFPHLKSRVSQGSLLGPLFSSKLGISTSLMAFNTVYVLTSLKFIFYFLAKASLLDSRLYIQVLGQRLHVDVPKVSQIEHVQV